MSIICVSKPVCWTPLEAITAYKGQHPELASERIAYAGRLDPMAEGLLVLLSGHNLRERDDIQMLPKTYIVDMVIGIATDTYDIMGMLSVYPQTAPVIPPDSRIRQAISDMKGTHEQPYPPYSSARVNGKPLFYWARSGELDSISIPSKLVAVHAVDILKHQSISVGEILQIQKQRLEKVNGIFRQQEILTDWKSRLESVADIMLPLYTLSITCSGGTYMRSLANAAGTALGTGAFCLGIKRTKVGSYSVEMAEKLE